MSTIKMLIMDSGEHILGVVVDESPESITLDKPVCLVPDPKSQGQSMMFMAYLQFSEENQAPFPARGIRHILTPNEGLLRGYNQQFGSGIVTPPDQGIILG